MDAGATWQYVSVGSPGLPTPVGSTPLHHIAVSPANASHMSVWWSVGASWNTTHAVTHDGGQTWQTATFDDTLAFMPQNGRDGKPVWHPTNASVHFNAGSDWITRSDDGGVTRAWAANGYNGVMVGSSFAFNYVNATLANVMFIAFQDYAGASTLDGGNTWTWRDVSGQGWGGAWRDLTRRVRMHQAHRRQPMRIGFMFSGCRLRLRWFCSVSDGHVGW